MLNDTPQQNTSNIEWLIAKKQFYHIFLKVIFVGFIQTWEWHLKTILKSRKGSRTWGSGGNIWVLCIIRTTKTNKMGIKPITKKVIFGSETPPPEFQQKPENSDPVQLFTLSGGHTWTNMPGPKKMQRIWDVPCRVHLCTPPLLPIQIVYRL